MNHDVLCHALGMSIAVLWGVGCGGAPEGAGDADPSFSQGKAALTTCIAPTSYQAPVSTCFLGQAKGIVAQSNGAGVPGGLILITAVDPAVAQLLGSLVVFTEKLAVSVGGTVTFDVVEQPVAMGTQPVEILAVNVVPYLGTAGKLISASQNGLTVGPNQAVMVTNGAQIGGNVTVDGGTLYVTNGSALNGKLTVTGTGSFLVFDHATLGGGNNVTAPGTFMRVASSVVNGKLSTQGIADLQLVGNTHDGKVTSTNDGNVTILSSTIQGKVTVSGAAACETGGNIVSGLANTSGCNDVPLDSTVVGYTCTFGSTSTPVLYCSNAWYCSFSNYNCCTEVASICQGGIATYYYF